MTPKDSYETIITFGKHKGKSLGFIYDSDPSYIHWLADSDKIPGQWSEAARRVINNQSVEDLSLPKSTYESKAVNVKMWVDKKDTISVSFAYDKELLERFKFEIDGRKWNNDEKHWVVPSPQIVKMVDLFGGTSNISATDDVKKIYRDEKSRRRSLDEIRVKDDAHEIRDVLYKLIIIGKVIDWDDIKGNNLIQKYIKK